MAKLYETNWLPTPKTGRFFGGIRAYAPQQQLIDGVYDPKVYDIPGAVKVQ